MISSISSELKPVALYISCFSYKTVIFSSIPLKDWTRPYRFFILKEVIQAPNPNNNINIVQYLASMSLQKCIVLLKCADEIFKIIEELQCKDIHSYCPILTISEYLSVNLNGIPQCSITIDKQQIYKNQVNQPKVEIWNEYIKQLLIKGYASVFQEKFYVLIPVEKYREQIIKKGLIFENVTLAYSGFSDQQILQKISTFKKDAHVKRKGLFLCQGTQKDLFREPMSHISSIMLGIVYNNDEWVIYDLPSMDKAPTIEQLQSLHAVFISGSLFSAYQTTQIFDQTFTNLRAAYQASSLKIMGICYGHQIISRFFGAKIGKNKHKTIITKIEKIELNRQIINRYDFLKQLDQFDTLYMTSLHGDEVYQAPQNFQIWASSVNTPVEGLISKDHRILTTQFHSEISCEYFNYQSEHRVACGIQGYFKLDNTSQQKIKNSQHSKMFLKIIRNFLQ